MIFGEDQYFDADGFRFVFVSTSHAEMMNETVNN